MADECTDIANKEQFTIVVGELHLLGARMRALSCATCSNLVHDKELILNVVYSTNTSIESSQEKLTPSYMVLRTG